MFKLAWTDGWMNMKRNFRETKYIYVIWAIMLIAGWFWNGVVSGFVGVYIASGTIIDAHYGKGNLMPDIFYMVPMNEKEKKRYILYRSFGIEWIFATMIGAIVFLEMFLKGKGFIWSVYMLVILWVCMICLKEQFYRIYKRINGKVYYPNMKTPARHIFRTFRVSDYISGVMALFCGGTVSSDNGTHLLVGYLGPVVIAYWLFSMIHFAHYVKKCINRMELPEML